MLALHDLGVILHIAVGAPALLLFWMPVLSRKGGRNHRKLGLLFSGAMYAVSISGILITGLDLLFPLAIHAADIPLPEADAAAARREVRISAHFLLSLSVLVLTATRQGRLAVLDKNGREDMRRPAHVMLCASLVLMGLTLLASGILNRRILLLVFGSLEIASGVGSLRYIFKDRLAPREWLTEHFRGLIGSGIGAYTAFAVLGGRTLLESLFADSFADISIVLWLAPSLVGGIATRYLVRRYRRLPAPEGDRSQTLPAPDQVQTA